MTDRRTDTISSLYSRILNSLNYPLATECYNCNRVLIYCSSYYGYHQLLQAVRSVIFVVAIKNIIALTCLSCHNCISCDVTIILSVTIVTDESRGSYQSYKIMKAEIRIRYETVVTFVIAKINVIVRKIYLWEHIS